MDERQGSLLGGMACALVSAGPIFITTMMLAHAYMNLPKPITASSSDVAIFVFIFFAAWIFGTLVSLPAILPGGLVMGALADRLPFLRPPIVWTMTGLMLGIVLALIPSDDSGPTALAWIVTSATCARICRQWIDWPEPEGDNSFVSPWVRQR